MTNIMRILMVTLSVFFVSATANAEISVAVTPFEASNYQLKKYINYARGELENIIMENDDVVVVERERMDKMTKEGSFGNFSGLADPSTSMKFGRMVGAQLLFTGSLLKADTKKKGFSGFGVSTKSKSTVATVRIRAYDAEKGIVIFSTTLKGSSSSFSTSFGGEGDEDPVSIAIEHALSKLKENKKFTRLFKTSHGGSAESAQIEVEFASTPDNCDVEVNGVYYGSSPMTVKLSSGTTVKVKISKPGYEIWEKTLMPREGMKIKPELIKKASK